MRRTQVARDISRPARSEPRAAEVAQARAMATLRHALRARSRNDRAPGHANRRPRPESHAADRTHRGGSKETRKVEATAGNWAAQKKSTIFADCARPG